jgi:hypothetical protein
MWQYRNRVLHNPDHPWKQQHIQDLDSRILDDFTRYCKSGYLQKDQRLFNSTAEHIQENYSNEQKEQWLESVAVARMRKTGTLSTTMLSARLFMQHWLTQCTDNSGEATM